ncbi:hypothetical protein E4U22_002743 [Claviceps purpurea]|nr:hypothetical protein E4U22_002743 [Claviceps purpurea]
MATSLFRRSLKTLSGRAWKPLAFPSNGFYVMPTDEKFEEEIIPGYKSSDYYPVRIGEVFRARYQAVGKLCFGRTSTVWLARDLSETNIQFGTDEAVLSAFEQEELDNPCPRKEAGGRTVYESRLLQAPKNLGAPVLCDFGSAMRLDDGIPRLGDIQPITYRAPEVILEIPWTSSVDIWNVGCMIWDTVQGETLFTGHDPELKTFRGRAHLAEMISDSAPWTSAAEPPRPNKLEKQIFFR